MGRLVRVSMALLRLRKCTNPTLLQFLAKMFLGKLLDAGLNVRTFLYAVLAAVLSGMNVVPSRDGTFAVRLAVLRKRVTVVLVIREVFVGAVFVLFVAFNVFPLFA